MKTLLSQVLPRGIGTRLFEQMLWLRVGMARTRNRLLRRSVSAPNSVTPTAILRNSLDLQRSVAEARSMGLPLHPEKSKNWDSIGAVGAVLNGLGVDARVLDVGAARYSVALPWLRIAGFRNLEGINLEFGRTIRHGPVRFRHGDATATGLDDESIDAVLCMSVIEHGVPIRAFLEESARIIRGGGLLCISTDYDQDPVDTSGLVAYGSPVHIFRPEEIRELTSIAKEAGFRLLGDLQLEHDERPVRWQRFGITYTFILLTFERVKDE